MDVKNDIDEPFEKGEGRKDFKKALFELFRDFLDMGGMHIWFDDECPDCKKVLDKKRNCTNKNCFIYQINNCEIEI